MTAREALTAEVAEILRAAGVAECEISWMAPSCPSLDDAHAEARRYREETSAIAAMFDPGVLDEHGLRAATARRTRANPQLDPRSYAADPGHDGLVEELRRSERRLQTIGNEICLRLEHGYDLHHDDQRARVRRFEAAITRRNTILELQRVLAENRMLRAARLVHPQEPTP